MIGVCYECKKRQVGCHATCEDYIRECEERTKRSEEIFNSRLSEYAANRYEVDRHYGAMKSRMNKGKSGRRRR